MTDKLGNNVGFIGKVNDDNLGQKYEEGLKKENVHYLYSKKKGVGRSMWNVGGGVRGGGGRYLTGSL